MGVTRRDVLAGAGALAGLRLLAPITFRSGTAWAAGADPALAARRRLVLIELGGGNDGLNTVVPRLGPNRSVYECVRNVTEIPAASLLPLERTAADAEHGLGLNPNLKTMHALYGDGRLAVVQGVDYPNHSYSHFLSMDIWHSGDPSGAPSTGWLGRHLDRTGIGEGELRAVGVGAGLPLSLVGEDLRGSEVTTLPMKFSDGTAAAAAAGHTAYGRYELHPASEPLRAYYGSVCGDAVAVVDATAGATVADAPTALADAMLTARELLTGDLGVEVVVVRTGGYDTHTKQTTAHPTLLTTLDRAVEAFFLGTYNGAALTKPVKDPLTGQTVNVPIGPLDPYVEARTLLMTYSEFGRRLGDNGDGTDHGAAAPLFLVGPPATGTYAPLPGSGEPVLVPGVHREHPVMSSSSCTRATSDNLAMTTDLRAVYQAVLSKWLCQATDGARADGGDPLFAGVSGIGVEAGGALGGLFAPA